MTFSHWQICLHRPWGVPSGSIRILAVNINSALKLMLCLCAAWRFLVQSDIHLPWNLATNCCEASSQFSVSAWVIYFFPVPGLADLKIPNNPFPLKQIYKGTLNLLFWKISLYLHVTGSSFHDKLMVLGSYCCLNDHKYHPHVYSGCFSLGWSHSNRFGKREMCQISWDCSWEWSSPISQCKGSDISVKFSTSHLTLQNQALFFLQVFRESRSTKATI